MHSSGMNGGIVNQNQETNISREEKTNVVPNIDLGMPVNRRGQSIERSIIKRTELFIKLIYDIFLSNIIYSAET